MNISEAKKFLNNNGYLLEDRFGGGKDRYGHKIKRLKLSDLDNEDEPAETEPVGDVEPSDLEPTEAPTEQPKTEPTEIKTNEDLLELTYTTLEDFPGYIDYDENGLTLVIHDLLQSKKDFLQRAGEIYGDIENSTNQKYEVALSELSYYMKKNKKDMETWIKGFFTDFSDYVKLDLRESGCDNILSVDIDLDYEKLYNACGDASVYVEQLNGLNEKCNLVKQYLANWIEVNLGMK